MLGEARSLTKVVTQSTQASTGVGRSDLPVLDLVSSYHPLYNHTLYHAGMVAILSISHRAPTPSKIFRASYHIVAPFSLLPRLSSYRAHAFRVCARSTSSSASVKI